MTTLIPCYAPPDREAAARVAAFLRQGTDARIDLDEGEMRPDQTIVDKAREARAADIVLVFFSQHTIPMRCARSVWESALQAEPAADGTRIAFVRCGACDPPRVLSPQFTLDSLRQLKRWVRGAPPSGALAPDLEPLSVALADRPGSYTVDDRRLADRFAGACGADFDAVCRVECDGRSLTALAGDLAAQLGLRLMGEPEQNLTRLREFCESRRFLILLEGAPALQLEFGGRTSTLFVECALADTGDALRRIQLTFGDPTLDADWAGLCDQARLGLRTLNAQGRVAEAYELMDQWHRAAMRREALPAMEESAREMVWILQQWDRTEEAERLDRRRVSDFAAQMSLPFLPADA